MLHWPGPRDVAGVPQLRCLPSWVALPSTADLLRPLGIYATAGVDLAHVSAFAGPGRHSGRAASLRLSRATAPLTSAVDHPAAAAAAPQRQSSTWPAARSGAADHGSARACQPYSSAGRSASDPPRLPLPLPSAGRLQLGLKGQAGGFFARITAPLALVGLAAVRQGRDVHLTGGGRCVAAGAAEHRKPAIAAKTSNR